MSISQRDDSLRPNPIQNDARARRREARFGPNPKCVLCPETRPEALTRVKRSEFIELHHVCNEANDAELLIPLCLACHRELTEKYKAAGVSNDDPETMLHRLCFVMRAFEIFFEDLGASCGRWDAALRQLIDWFDDNLPAWRQWAIW